MPTQNEIHNFAQTLIDNLANAHEKALLAGFAVGEDRQLMAMESMRDALESHGMPKLQAANVARAVNVIVAQRLGQTVSEDYLDKLARSLAG